MKSVIVAFLLLVSSQVSAGIKAFIDRQDIHTNETFTLTVELDEYTNNTPDLSLFPKELNVLGSSKFHSSSIINGVSKTRLGWKIQLMADEPGVYTIPAIEVGQNKTSPIQLTVKKSSSSFSTDEQVEAIMLKADVSKDSVFVQEQVVFTIKLYRALQTQYASLTEPNLNDALVEKLGEDVQYETTVDGQRYFVLERKYAIFPQKSGELEIPEIVFSADVVQRNNGGFGRLLGRTRPVSVSTDPKTVSVKTYPQGHSGLWLPSKKVSIDSRWSNSKQHIVGQPSTWTITLTGVGLHENQLPELDLPTTQNVKWYPDTAEKSRNVTNDGIVGKRVERIAVVPTKPGTIQLPKISFRWYNTETNQYETAELKAQTIQVTPNPEIKSSPEPQVNTLVEPTSETAETPSISTSRTSNPLWVWLTLLFAILWIATLLLWLTNRKNGNLVERKSHYNPLDNIDLKTQIEAAINAKNSAKLYQHLLNWMNTIDGPASFNQHLSKIHDADIRDGLKSLEASLYAGSKSNWDKYGQVKGWLKSIEKQLTINPKKQTNNALPELYPSN
ncbi:BatD family protein [Pleionea sediminis]|uniref:BatD family protein n=1 Tax=Pleionea sediminis TaxID=2569479 RepID=UPI001185E1D4|nr:BatD family protein [Pleionea sediminis]